MRKASFLSMIMLTGVFITASSNAYAVSADCRGWAVAVKWGGTAYGTVTASLRKYNGSSYTVVESSQDGELYIAASPGAEGTLSFSGTWNTAPLDGTYQVQFNATIYSGLNHEPTAQELLTWPNIRSFGAVDPIMSCSAPPAPKCGNRIIEGTESCDDGNTVSGDGCSAACKTEVCGDATLDSGEQCDDGNVSNGDGCSTTCTVEVCGNGILDTNEYCDDGNLTNNDGCSSSCTLERCGDTVIQNGEQCDDGNTLAGDGCSETCGLEECGNGVIEGSEECDDANMIGGDGCSAACTLEYCGNGVVEMGEQCDDSNNQAGDGCSHDCNYEVCGNGIRDPGEACDDGNLSSGDGCSSTCTVEICGNGVVEGSETCDDGNVTNGDGCSAACVIEPPPPPPVRGCTRTIGYWKNHNALAKNRAQKIAWPISESTMLCGRTWLSILDTPPRGNAWFILAHQYIGTRLNLAAGASSTPDVDAALRDGAALLAQCSVSDAQREAAVSAASLLDNYNNGIFGPGHCK